MARPKKADTERHSHTLRFTVRPSEYVRIHHGAIRSGLTISQYLRDVVLGRPITITQTRGLDPDLFEELRRVGVNLNQAVKYMHTHETVPPELLSAAAAIERFLKENLDHGAEGRG
ncbi:plasmid mobilization protein [Hyphomicrobium sp. MC8b]|uniref:plasmid mobilization protein n=1 Tax=Hyphomicrobium sp. MC8b TaxID=300273 RepID=UPI00391AF072